MTQVNVYEDNGGMLHAVIRENGKITNILSGFEDGMLSGKDFIDAARYGFYDADEYDPSNYSGYQMEDVAEEMSQNDDLIAEITEDDVELHINKMGFAGSELFGIKI